MYFFSARTHVIVGSTNDLSPTYDPQLFVIDVFIAANG